MKRLSFLLISSSILCSAYLNAQTSTVTLADGETVKIRLANKDPRFGGYRNLSFGYGEKATNLAPKNPISCIPASAQERQQSGFPDKINGFVLDPSRCFFRAEYSVNSQKRTLLLFISEGGASDAASMLAVGFSTDHHPFKILEQDELDVTSLDVAENSAAIIGKPTLSQVMMPALETTYDKRRKYATTYDPFVVYVIDDNYAAKYSLEMSKQYNESHYVWAGPPSREDYAVVFNAPGHPKPFGIPAKELDKLFGKAKPPAKP